ncbi:MULTISPECIES: DUF3105 domain-containing protein [Nocardia]|uniref:DUF3105 domain-containing protein n=1 Tax=Nocardia asteroides NBRC 15531 TaxID=1110697 RepID=U5EAB3_NOCAS|nr:MULTISPECIES: DUF3105 domain-containing protein [Nocardia]TLF63344.1 DUF3105 domain-containing protein [Nocardia asteroides NBRC 15531]UGT47233.1 DUF3105 domain-containing protein [Nocardia asteroides]SFM75500.1 Protein of unknown function [Nocardia asteroides]VEG33882.1 Protein of uncharacterised function (DUF3105) [Nocardia asteroides]GAD87042.1 hypothetical protein NCAST_34_01700 [Nocardia asteroides NBRC 15531]
MINKSRPPAGNRKRGSRAVKKAAVGKVARKQPPWPLIGATAAIIALTAGLAWHYVPKYREYTEAQRYVPGTSQPDPSDRIDGVTKQEYPAGSHVRATQRVAYDQSPPFGGPHDQSWATCTGEVYASPIRSENAVHSLEHGAIWVTYNPDRLDTEDLAALRDEVDGKPYMLMSPYPNLDSPVALQSWGRQLKLDNVDDPRIARFVTALRQNPNTHPEPGASCATPGAGFNPDAPPPFDPAPPGPDAVPLNPAGSGSTNPSGGRR